MSDFKPFGELDPDTRAKVDALFGDERDDEQPFDLPRMVATVRRILRRRLVWVLWFRTGWLAAEEGRRLCEEGQQKQEGTRL